MKKLTLRIADLAVKSFTTITEPNTTVATDADRPGGGCVCFAPPCICSAGPDCTAASN
ncbi:MAG TPA: hypothetical protein VF665_02555 [Longimicrobium sp.]|jgi:hypothetical protein|uniref:hypothetical protein n=1 Tax=Longimicrobium sp. TaxID=2029185 RepID=UPI002EDA38DE